MISDIFNQIENIKAKYLKDLENEYLICRLVYDKFDKITKDIK